MPESPPPTSAHALEAHERAALRVLLRYAAVMLVAGLASGVFYRESTKHLERSDLPPGFFLEATLPFALAHGHIVLLASVLPMVFAGMLTFARAAGGAPLRPRTLRWLLWGYLPAAALSVLLVTLKGWRLFDAAHSGARDLAAVDASFLGGSGPLRIALYGGAHLALAVSAFAFLWGLWHSLDPEERDA